MHDQLVTQTIDVGAAEITILQPEESAELPDDREVEWAPLVPYWSVLWRSGVALAREVAGMPLAGRRVVELGCGLGAPSLAAAAGGARVLATDGDISSLRSTDQTSTGEPADPSIDYTAPSTIGSVQFWVVIRDGRGGVGWITRTTQVR